MHFTECLLTLFAMLILSEHSISRDVESSRQVSAEERNSVTFSDGCTAMSGPSCRYRPNATYSKTKKERKRPSHDQQKRLLMEVKPRNDVQPGNITAMLSVAQHFLVFVQINNLIEKAYIRRPVYNIANMVNSIDRFDDVMDVGANGIGMDIEYFPNGTVSYARYSSADCNCLRLQCESGLHVPRLLNYIRESTRTHGGNHSLGLAIMILRLQLENVVEEMKEEAGINIAKLIINNLWKEASYWEAVNVVVSTQFVEDREVIVGVRNTVSDLKPLMVNKIGFETRDEMNLTKLRDLYLSFGVPGNYWLGDGISTCLRKDRPSRRLQAVLDARDTDKRERYAEKVYQRTVDLAQQMARSLRRGVDAIVTNKPKRLTRLIRKGFSSTVRLATVLDDPWKRFDGWEPFLRLQRNRKIRLGDRFSEVIHGVND